jgi:hypothetical protein
MDRINGLNTVDIGGGKRGFRKKNKAAGLAGTEVTDGHMNALQEEVLYCIEQSGQVPAINDWTQLWKAIGIRLGGLRVLVAPTTFYVNGASGNDANDGLTAGTAFATMQGAVDKIAASYIALQTVTISVANGSYAGFEIKSSLIASWSFIGNQASPQSVILQEAVGARRCAVFYSCAVTMRGFTFSGIRESVIFSGCSSSGLYVSNRFLGGSGAGMIVAYEGSAVSIEGTVTVAGGGCPVVSSNRGSSINLGNSDGSFLSPVIFALIGTPNFPAFAVAAQSGTISTNSTLFSFSGSATGQRYSAYQNGTIQTGGSGANLFPGSTAGATSTGGQYG